MKEERRKRLRLSGEWRCDGLSLLTWRPVEQCKAGCSKRNQDDGNPHEEPADDREEGGEFEDDRTADESIQWS